MKEGIFAFLAGAALVICALLTGRLSRSKTDRLKNELSQARGETARAELEKDISGRRADLASDVTPIAVRTAVEQTEAKAEYESVLKDIRKARTNNDMDALGAIAAKLAEKALSMGAKEKR